MSNERIWYALKDSAILEQYMTVLLAHSMEYLQLFRMANERPHSMTNEIVDKTKKHFNERKEIIKSCEEQVLKWKDEAKSSFEKQEVVRFTQMVETLTQVNQEILGLADYISGKTIESILNMDDFELGLKFLAGEITLPKK